MWLSNVAFQDYSWQFGGSSAQFISDGNVVRREAFGPGFTLLVEGSVPTETHCDDKAASDIETSDTKIDELAASSATGVSDLKAATQT